jgi:hypothetical protein
LDDKGAVSATRKTGTAVLTGSGIDNSDASDQFLNGKGSDGNHGKSTVLNLGQLHGLLGFFILGVDSEGVKAEVATAMKG